MPAAEGPSGSRAVLLQDQTTAMAHVCANSWCERAFDTERALFHHSRVCRQNNWRGHPRENRALDKDAMPNAAIYAPSQLPLLPESLPSNASLVTPNMDMSDLSAPNPCSLEECDEQHLAFIEECYQTSDLAAEVMSLLMRNLTGELLYFWPSLG